MKSDLPTHWSWVKLGDVCEKLTDGSHYSPKSVATGYPYVTVKDVSNDKINFDDCKRITKNEYVKLVVNDCNPKRNDVLFSKDGTVGKVSLIDFDKEFIVLSSLAILRPNTKTIFPRYLFHILKSSKFLNQALSKKKGVAIRRIILRDLKELLISLPPLPEQKKIVEKIEELFSGLDSGVASLKKAKEQIRLYRQSVLASAFSGKLVKDAKRETKNELEAYLNGVQGVAKAAVPKVEYSNQLPIGWKWVKLGEVLEVKDGTHDTPKYHDKGIPFITQKNIKNGEFVFDNYNLISEEDHQKFYKRSNVASNDIIISMIGANRGMSTIVKTKETFSIKNVGLVKTDESKFLAKYLAYFFKSEIGQSSILSQSKGGAQQFIGLTELRNWSVPFQPLNQQTQIVEEIEKRFSEADNLEKAIDDSLAKSETLRQSILKQAFSGKLIMNN